MEVPVKKGFNRLSWRFDRNAAPVAGMIPRTGQEGQGRQGGGAGFQGARMGGGRVLPGTYKVKMTLGEESSTTEITILNDPRMESPDIEAANKNLAEADSYIPKIIALNQLYEKFSEISTVITKVDEYVGMDSRIAEEVKDVHNPFKEKYTTAERRLTGRPEGLFVKINNYRILTTSTRELTADEIAQVAAVSGAIEEATKLMNEIISEGPQYLEKIKAKKIPLEVVIR